MKVVIFEQNDGSVAILYPVTECIDIYGIDALAKKDVPPGLQYWIVDAESVPTDRAYRDAWRIDHAAMGWPHGFGCAASTFEEVLHV